MYYWNLVPCAILVLTTFQSGLSQSGILTFEIRLDSLLNMQQGIGWPIHLNVAKGHEALMRLSRNLMNQQSCEVTTPAGVTFSVDNPPNNRYISWSDGCGVRVRDVEASDEGRWRLTSRRGNTSITGWSEVHVEDKIDAYTPPSISLQDGATQTQVDLTSLSNSYCLVAQPFAESSLVPGHCTVTLDRTTRAVQGRWNVLLGLPGRVSELHVEKNVAVEAERLDSGFIRDTASNKLHLYCNILHSAKNITFCRFQKTSQSSGFNVMDGLSDGRHSYYGDGFLKRQCGLTIESVSAADFGTWRCTVGVQQWVGNAIRPSTPMQALIRAQATATRESSVRRSLERTSDEIKTVFVQKDTVLTISCRAEESLTYCWFQHPNGSQYTPVERQLEEEQQFWYTGESLQTGECGITFAKVKEEDAGLWTCHMGPSDQLGVELTDTVAVRVTGPLAANKNEISVRTGGTAILYCHTANGNRPLDYCRFLSPRLVGISVDATVTAENAILDRYYFTPERDLAYGDCSLTINPVLEEDLGEWTCAALLHDLTVESRDVITVFSDGSRRFRADIFGSLFGVGIILIVLAGTFWYKRGSLNPFRGISSTESTDAISMGEFTTSPRTSSSTNSSTDEQVLP